MQRERCSEAKFIAVVWSILTPTQVNASSLHGRIARLDMEPIGTWRVYTIVVGHEVQRHGNIYSRYLGARAVLLSAFNIWKPQIMAIRRRQNHDV